MSSQKNSSQKTCIKCAIMLTDENWLKYLQPRSNYICTSCFRLYGKTHHKKDLKYKDKQLARTRFRKSAVIFSYGNMCVQCQEDDYEKLTIDHIHGNGNKHKKEIGNLYEWLYNNPVLKDEYQVLCYNCDCSKNVKFKDKYALHNKKQVINNYGGYCIICNEDKIERLTINNSIKEYHQVTGSKMYRWIIKNNYPSNLGFKILCFNCEHIELSKHKIVLELNGI